MVKKNVMGKSAVAAVSALAFATSVSAPMVGTAQAQEMEKCYGIAAAGKNDCATATSSCAGSAKKDRQKDAFIYVPAGTCDKISGGSKEPKKG